MRETVELEINEPRPDQDERKTIVRFDPAHDYFSYHGFVGKSKRKVELSHGKIKMLDDQDKQIDEQNQNEAEKRMVTRLPMFKNYYHYLWFLPQNSNYPGTIIHPEVKTVDFFGKELLEIKVTYEPAVGEDIWYVYFDPVSYAMSGYRFYHDEAANDGEYILIEGETVFENIRIPKTRKWYKHQKDEYLGMDDLMSFKVIKSKN